MLKLKLNKDDYPWYDFYGDVPHHLEYPKGSMVDVLMDTVLKLSLIHI